MMESIGRYLIFTVAALSILSCRSTRSSKPAPVRSPVSLVNPNNTNRKDSALRFSQQLGIALPNTANFALVGEVAAWMGVPYKYGGNDKSGVDCSGFINLVFAKVYGLKVPRVTAEIHKAATEISGQELKEGDLVFFKINTKLAGHAGIYLYDGYFAHASTSRGVMISRLAEPYWSKYFLGAGRFREINN